jgi:hypothetical protein
MDIRFREEALADLGGAGVCELPWAAEGQV